MPHAGGGEFATLDGGSEVNYGASGFCVHEDLRPSPTTGKGTLVQDVRQFGTIGPHPLCLGALVLQTKNPAV